MADVFVLRAYEEISRELEAARVRYLVVGGLAVYAYGSQRATHDIDLVIQLEQGNVLRAFAALEKASYRPLVPMTAAQFGDASERQQAIRDKDMVVLNFWSDRYPLTRLDVFVAEPFDFDAEYEKAHVEHLLPGVEFRYPRVEALLSMKRKAGRPKDLLDIEWLERYAKK